MKKKVISIALVIALIAVIAVGSFAYFTDTKSANNVFTMGDVKITLDEAKVTHTGDKWTAGDERVTGNEYGSAYPGAVLPKDPTVHNNSADGNGAYIRATVTITGGMNFLGSLYKGDAIVGEMPDAMYTRWFTKFVGGALGNGWSVVKMDDASYASGDLIMVLKYDDVLAAGASTTAMFKELVIPADYDANNGQGAYESFGTINVNVTADAIQANGFADWNAAFAAFDAK